MSRHRLLGAGLLAAVLLSPGPLNADEPPPGMPPEFQQMMRAEPARRSSRKFPPLDRTLDGGVEGLKTGRVADAEAVLKRLTDRNRGDASFPLYQLTLGSVELGLGDYQGTVSALTAATTNLSVELGSVRTGIAILSSESDRPYRGYPHEKMLARTYLGLAYFQQARHEDARIEFAKAREEHRGSKAGQDADFVTGHFLEGLNSLRDRRYEDAQVSFRKVTELKNDWPLGWYALCRASELAGGTPEADESWARYEALTTAGPRLARDGSTPCALFLVESGWAPVRKPGKLIDDLGAWERGEAPPATIALGPVGEPGIPAPTLDDLYFHASTSGGVVGEAGRKVVSSAAKGLVRHLPGVGRFLAGKEEVDVRRWAAGPGAMHVVAVPLPARPASVELVCKDKKGKSVPANHQVFHYLRGRPFGEAPLVYARVLPDAGARETLHGRSD
jgi:hypothetical protein